MVKVRFYKSIVKGWWNTKKGMSLIEAILGIAIFGLLVTGLSGVWLVGERSSVSAAIRGRALLLVDEGAEALRNLSEDNFDNLTPGVYGLSTAGGFWSLTGSSDVVDIFTRTITITSLDADRRQVDITVSWDEGYISAGSVSLTSYYTNWRVTAGVDSDYLQVTTSTAVLDPGDNTRIIGVDIENIGVYDITIESLVVSWTGGIAGTKINEVSIAGSSVWSGNKNSGLDLNITDFVVVSGDGAYDIDFFGFSKDMTATSITLEFIMSDASSKIVSFGLPGAPVDSTAPSAVVDLVAGNPSTSSIDLTWTAPGDDDNTGTATSYDIRYSTSLITDANWTTATAVVGEPVPSVAGSAESMTVSGLAQNTTYYFAIKTADEVPNISNLSNVSSVATLTVVTSEADNLSVSAGGVTIDPGNNKKIIGITIQNTGGSNITIASMILTWTGAPGGTKSKEIQINGSSLWAGNGKSGDLLDITDFVLVSGAGSYPINFLRFSKNMTGATLDITFIMSDASTKSVTGLTP